MLKTKGRRVGRRRSPTRKTVKGGRKNWITGKRLEIYQKSNIKGGSAAFGDGDPAGAEDPDAIRAEDERNIELGRAASEMSARADRVLGDGDEIKSDEEGDGMGDAEHIKSEEPSLGDDHTDVIKPPIKPEEIVHHGTTAKKHSASTYDKKSDDASFKRLAEIYGNTQQLKAQQDEIRRENQRLIDENKRISSEHQRMNDIHEYDRNKEYRLRNLLWDLIPADSYYRDILKDKINDILRRELMRETKTNDVKTDSEMVQIVKSLIKKSMSSAPRKTSRKKSAKKSSKKKSSKKKSAKKKSAKKSAKKKSAKKSAKKK
jgi:hypothetical protein